jgi:hypothetical protein
MATPPNLINGYNQLYNQIFCNLFQSTTNNGFSTCDNCNFSYNNANNVLSTSSTSGEQSCLNSCKSNPYCTAYTFQGNNSGNTSGQNCTLYGLNNSYPTQINSNVIGSYSGYDITPPKANYNYNNLNSEQQQNVQFKCSNQFLNNTFTPKKPDINLSSCITFSNQNNNTEFNTDPECVFNVYEQNKIPVKIKNVANYTNLNGINTASVGDPNITNYENSYNQYNTLKEQNSSINQQLSSSDNANYPQYFQTLTNDNQTLFNDFLGNIEGQGGQLSDLSLQINQSIGGNIEGFENKNNNKLLIIILIIFVLIFIFFVFKKK